MSATTTFDRHEQWLRAVALGGQGRYSAARTILMSLRHSADAVVRSLAASTEASLDRQLGWHARASVLDGKAVAIVGITGHEQHSYRAAAACDALTGAAADSLGRGDPKQGIRLLNRCETIVDYHGERLWRANIRLCWVRSEFAMSIGDSESALRHARDAVRSSVICPSTRHSVKSELVLAAALLVAGDSDSAAAHAESVGQSAERHALVPLAWAAAMISRATDTAGADAVRLRHEVTIRQRGGVFRK